MLARSRANTIDPDDNVTDVDITKTPSSELPDEPEVGFTPARANPPRPALYRPRPGLKGKLLTAPMNSVGWLADLHLYRRKRTEGDLSPEDAWKELKMHPTNADTSLNRNLLDRGSIPPELIGRVVAGSKADDSDSPGNVEGVILYPS